MRYFSTPGFSTIASMSVYEFLSSKLDTARGGGRVKRLKGENKFVVLDCPEWDERDTRALRKAYPDATVWMAAENASLSGFAVFVSVPSRRRRAWAIVLGLVLSCVVYTLWYLWNLPSEPKL